MLPPELFEIMNSVGRDVYFEQDINMFQFHEWQSIAKLLARIEWKLPITALIFMVSGHLHNKHKNLTHFGRNPRVFLEWNNIFSTFSHIQTLPNMEWALDFYKLYQIQMQHNSCETQEFIFTWFIDINFSSVLRPSVTFFFYQIVTKNTYSQIGRSQHTSYLSIFYTTAIRGQEMIDLKVH